MLHDPISEADWLWLREHYGDFVLEEPAYAPKLLQLRDALDGMEHHDRGALVDLDTVCDCGAGGEGMLNVRQFTPEKG